MATKKAASPKKTASATPAVKKQSTTKPTTVKAVESRPTYKATSTSGNTLLQRATSAPFIAAVVSEFIGAFLLAAIVIAAQGQPILVLFGLAGIIMVIGTLSGGYANPALTIGAWATKRLTGLRAIGYIIAQVLGAMLALVLLNSFIQASGSSSSQMLGQQATLFKAAELTAGKEWYVFAAELIGTAIFGFAVAAASRFMRERVTAGLTVGLGVYTALLIGGSLAAMVGATAVLNPAVAVALQAIHFNSVWPIAIYGVASALGAVIGFYLYDFLRTAETEAGAETDAVVN